MEPFWTSFSQSGYLSIVLGILIPIVGAGIVFLIARARRDDSPGSKADMAGYPERVKELSAELARASSELEHVLEEMAIVSRLRTEAFGDLELRVKEMATHEKDLQTRVQTLKNISLPPAEYYLQVHEQPKPKPGREYQFFVIGAIASALLVLGLKLLLNI